MPTFNEFLSEARRYVDVGDNFDALFLTAFAIEENEALEWGPNKFGLWYYVINLLMNENIDMRASMAFMLKEYDELAGATYSFSPLMLHYIEVSRQFANGDMCTDDYMVHTVMLLYADSLTWTNDDMSLLSTLRMGAESMPGHVQDADEALRMVVHGVLMSFNII
jgi:hypothetical protein